MPIIFKNSKVSMMERDSRREEVREMSGSTGHIGFCRPRKEFWVRWELLEDFE